MNVGHGVENLPFGLLADLRCCCCGCGGGRCSCHSILLEFLDAATRAFARPRIGPRALASQRQAAAMPNTSVATEIHESLDVHCDLTAEVTLDRELRDDVAQARDLGLGEILDLRGRLDAGRFAGHHRAVAADTEDVRQRNPNVLVGGNVDARYTCHSVLTPSPDAVCAAGLRKSRARLRDGGRSCTSDKSCEPMS